MGRSCLATAIILAVAASAGAMIIGPGSIVPFTVMSDSGHGFTIDQMCDGISLDYPFNGFAAAPGVVGTIHLTLVPPAAIGDFVLWNDINVLYEGISEFSLVFFGPEGAYLGRVDDLVGPLGSVEPVVYSFSPFEDVARVDLVVHTLNLSQLLEIREVAFNWNDVVPTESQTWSQLKALFE